MSVHHPWSLSALFLAMAMISGCVGKTESLSISSTSDTDTHTDASTSGSSKADSNAEIQPPVAGGEEALDSIPEDIYIAESHASSQLNEIGGKQNLILEYPARDIASFIETYHDGMKEQGWTLVTSSDLPIGTIANFSKDDRKCTVSIADPKDQIIKVAIVLPQE